MTMKQIRNLVLSLSLLSIVALVSFRVGQATGKETIVSKNDGKLDLSMMWKVKDSLSKSFLEKDKLDDKKMVYGAIEGMVSALDDPYTMYLPPTENKSSNDDLAGEFGGVGIQLGYKDKNLAVIAPLPKTPAAIAGVQAGDLILKITDKAKNVEKDTYGINLDEAMNLIRGKIGTDVTLKLFRESKKEPFDLTLKRDNIVVASMDMEWKEKAGKKVAVIRLYKFTETLYTDWPVLVDKINAEKAKMVNYGGMILDLRNNPGGFLEASVMVGSDFIQSGTIVKQQSTDGKTVTYDVDKTRGKLLNDKLVVLVNGGSASASEILSGALKDYKRATLVGEKTFGKGTVQEPQQFSDGSGLHVTIAKWLLPNGSNIHKVGIEPDVEVKLGIDDKEDVQQNKALDILLAK